MALVDSYCHIYDCCNIFKPVVTGFQLLKKLKDLRLQIHLVRLVDHNVAMISIESQPEASPPSGKSSPLQPPGFADSDQQPEEKD